MRTYVERRLWWARVAAFEFSCSWSSVIIIIIVITLPEWITLVRRPSVLMRDVFVVVVIAVRLVPLSDAVTATATVATMARPPTITISIWRR